MPPEKEKKGLSRDFVVRSILKLFDEFESLKKWGKVEVTIQAGNFKTIEKRETIVSENKV